MKADGRTKWTFGWSFLPKNVRYDNPDYNISGSNISQGYLYTSLALKFKKSYADGYKRANTT
jgi:hypothetical protein